MIAEGGETALLQVLGVDKDARDALDEPFGVKTWPLPGAQPRPVKAREPGVPDWWTGDEDASEVFLKSMGVHL